MSLQPLGSSSHLPLHLAHQPASLSAGLLCTCAGTDASTARQRQQTIRTQVHRDGVLGSTSTSALTGRDDHEKKSDCGCLHCAAFVLVVFCWMVGVLLFCVSNNDNLPMPFFVLRPNLEAGSQPENPTVTRILSGNLCFYRCPLPYLWSTNFRYATVPICSYAQKSPAGALLSHDRHSTVKLM